MHELHIGEPSQRVTREDLEALLASLEKNVADPRAGIFGPNSMSWRINRESALFLGAGRAAILQLAHPWVATALAQHSSLLNAPVARFHNTFRVVFTTIFGSAPQAFAAARSLHQLHTRIRGDLSSSVGSYKQGSSYEANFVPALRWVYATLVDSAILAHDCAMPQLTGGERDAYYAESRTLAALFGIPASALPPDWNSFSAYMDEMFASSMLGVNQLSRDMARNVLAGAGSWMRPPKWYRALTTAWLPLRFREEFQLPFGIAEESISANALERIPRVYQRLPAALRYVGTYLEARSRLAQQEPGLVAQLSSRFWIGRPRLPFGE